MGVEGRELASRAVWSKAVKRTMPLRETRCIWAFALNYHTTVFGDFLPTSAPATTGFSAPNLPFASGTRFDIVGVTSSNLVPPTIFPQ
jgi:hypothetical protein